MSLKIGQRQFICYISAKMRGYKIAYRWLCRPIVEMHEIERRI